MEPLKFSLSDNQRDFGVPDTRWYHIISRLIAPSLKFVETVHPGLIKKINDIECTECGFQLIVREGCPQTGYCGHLFCHRCAKEKKDAFIETLNDKFDKLPIEIQKGLSPGFNKDLYNKLYNSQVAGTRISGLYQCKKCNRGVPTLVGLRSDDVGRYYQLFIDNTMLKKIYDALRAKKGIECDFITEENRRCGQLHPRHNMVLRKHRSNDTKVYYCVWHAKIEREADLVLAPSDTTSGTLESLDRTERVLFAGLYHCARCATQLLVDNYNRSFHHLECGHLIGHECYDGVLNMPRSLLSGVFCIFCKIQFSKSWWSWGDGQEYSDRHQLVPSKDMTYMLNGFRTEDCRKCERLHPAENVNSGLCKWCNIENVQNGRQDPAPAP